MWAFAAQSQSVSKNEIMFIKRTVGAFVDKYGTNYENQKPQFLLIFLETDSAGGIKSIRILSEENATTVFLNLKELTISDFKGSKFKKCKNKVIVLPIYVLKEMKANDKGEPIISWVDKIIIDFTHSFERKKCVIIPPLFFLIPETRI